MEDSYSVKEQVYTAGSLFSGMGGMCLGFQKAGVENLWAVELDDAACALYRANLDTQEVLCQDVCEVSPLAHKLPSVDILHAGFPCQSFSQAGGRKGFADPRGQLFFEIPRIVQKLHPRPRAIVLENSPFIRYGSGGAWFQTITMELRKLGYWFSSNSFAELNTAEITPLPQDRTRLFMVALSIDHVERPLVQFPRTTSKRKRLGEIIDFAGEQDDDTLYLPKENRYHGMISRSMMSGENIYQLRKYLVRSKLKGLCPTLTANMGQGGHNVPFVFDARGLRKLSIRECLELQGFEKRHVVPENLARSKVYASIGNSVTVPVAKKLAQSVVQSLAA